jgi:hypothetical protein
MRRIELIPVNESMEAGRPHVSKIERVNFGPSAFRKGIANGVWLPYRKLRCIRQHVPDRGAGLLRLI